MPEATRLDRDRVALNPIQWYATEDGWLDPSKGPALPELLDRVRSSGFRFVHAQPPAAMTLAEYRALLDGAGLGPAPGYFSIGLPEHGVTIDETVELARRAAAEHAELALSDIFIGCRMTKEAVRVRRPAIGAEADAARSETILSIVDRISSAMKEEGVRPALHPHIGTWIETEDEARTILDALPASQLGFGPDTGHLSWAGANVTALMTDYRDRVSAVHVKDCHMAVAAGGKTGDKSYQEVVLDGLWAEPGDGDLDL
ncbi:sugar phosphate isomerase/epimerase family protein, partial [Pararhizobium mangrovi]